MMFSIKHPKHGEKLKLRNEQINNRHMEMKGKKEWQY